MPFQFNCSNLLLRKWHFSWNLKLLFINIIKIFINSLNFIVTQPSTVNTNVHNFEQNFCSSISNWSCHLSINSRKWHVLFLAEFIYTWWKINLNWKYLVLLHKNMSFWQGCFVVDMLMHGSGLQIYRNIAAREKKVKYELQHDGQSLTFPFKYK